jgi:hypothetical protein
MSKSKVPLEIAFYFGFQLHLIAFDSHAKTHGVLLVSGLQDEQVYLIFLRCSSLTAATVLSSKSINSVWRRRAI